MIVDLSALLDYHSALFKLKSEFGQAPDEDRIWQTTDIPTMNVDSDEYHMFSMPFSLNQSTISPDGIDYFGHLRIVFDDDEWVRFLWRWPTQGSVNDSSEMVLYSNGSDSSPASDTSASMTLTVGVIYVMKISITRLTLTTFRVWANVTPLSQVDWTLGGTLGDTLIVQTVSSGALIDEMYFAGYYADSSDVEARIDLYELHYVNMVDIVAGPYKSPWDHMLMGAPRTMIMNYYAPPVLDKLFLLPSRQAFEGTIYDQTDLLNELIEAQDIEIAALETKAIALQADIDGSETGFLAWLKTLNDTTITNVGSFAGKIFDGADVTESFLQKLWDRLMDTLFDSEEPITFNTGV